ncbi:MAG: F0F1 ATP synthase subunit epsilon [Terriglobales bacterium]|jgi:F-type H+-transporting ATPase subunit epsilon
MANTFQLEIVTPSRLLVKEAAEEAQVPGLSGYLGILPGHAPLISELAVGVLTYKASGTTHTLSVAWGFMEVLPDKVTILAEAAERPPEIDTERALKSKDRAEQRLKSNDPQVDYTRAEDALQRAETRLNVAKDVGKDK